MSPDDIPSAKNSSFLSLFSRKKRINRSITESLDENKTITSPSNARFLTNGQKPTNITHTNGYGNLENSEMLMVPLEPASTSWAKEFPLPHQSLPQQQQQQSKTDFAFPDRKRYYQNSRMHQHISGENSDILSNNNRSRSESRAMTDKSPVLMLSKKAYSVDTMNNHSDPGYLMEALETLADTQPRVARSIPKHAIVDTSNFAARSLDNCLFDATVYDAMLHDSLKRNINNKN
ncbi:unnamed protein product [Onchocerca flexuosa]|uniref:Uncharacterized protein n=1 Tax=Onchocerca flexuosa TaxID=387005 RepID=A0A183HCZ0_9BILA|nr:unnamed protein product [Onchocerca flexuosa]